jgi:hypothetical protein
MDDGSPGWEYISAGGTNNTEIKTRVKSELFVIIQDFRKNKISARKYLIQYKKIWAIFIVHLEVLSVDDKLSVGAGSDDIP